MLGEAGGGPHKRVSELYGRHPGADIYVVGTGPSLRVFPTGFLDGKITIGLNLAWKAVPVTYGITIHPELAVPELLAAGRAERPAITWVTKREKLGKLTPDQVRRAEDEFYFFRSDGPATTVTHGLSDAGRVPDWARSPTGDHLYLWGSVATAGANLAANLGAANVILVGCDNAALLGNHHVQAQHTRWLGAQPDDRYRDYYEGLADVRAAFRDRGVGLVSLTPFLTLGPHEHDFLRLCDELDVPAEVPPLPDISGRPASTWSRTRGRLARVRRLAGGWSGTRPVAADDRRSDGHHEPPVLVGRGDHVDAGESFPQGPLAPRVPPDVDDDPPPGA